MAQRQRQSSPRRRNPTNELDVSAELLELREKVNTTFAGKFFRELDDIKALALSQQFQIDPSNMSSTGNGNTPNQDISMSDAIKERIYNVEREFRIEMVKITERIEHLLNYVKDNTSRIDDLDQDRRATSLIFQGVPEVTTKPPEYQILEIIKDKLDIFVPKYPCCGDDDDSTNSDLVPPFVIARAFRMGKPRTDAQIAKMGPRPIMVNFGSLFFRDKVMASRRNLRNSKMYITESLTRPRYELLLRAREVVGTKNAWSMDGKIFIMANEEKRRITKLEDLPRPV